MQYSKNGFTKTVFKWQVGRLTTGRESRVDLPVSRLPRSNPYFICTQFSVKVVVNRRLDSCFLLCFLVLRHFWKLNKSVGLRRIGRTLVPVVRAEFMARKNPRRNIARIEVPGEGRKIYGGWEVRIQRRGERFSKYFSDLSHGGKRLALQSAKVFRDEIDQRFKR